MEEKPENDKGIEILTKEESDIRERKLKVMRAEIFIEMFYGKPPDDKINNYLKIAYYSVKRV